MKSSQDTLTAKNLELVANTNDSSTQNTLLKILNHTLTPMGKRLLRMNILQPPCSIDVIKDRLDAIEELSESEESIFNIQSCLKLLNDLDYTIAYLVRIPTTIHGKNPVTSVRNSEMKVNQIIALKQAIKSIKSVATYLPPKVQTTLEGEEDTHILLRTIYKVLY